MDAYLCSKILVVQHMYGTRGGGPTACPDRPPFRNKPYTQRQGGCRRVDEMGADASGKRSTRTQFENPAAACEKWSHHGHVHSEAPVGHDDPLLSPGQSYTPKTN
ncbi:unnamed protein product [Nesidiocoris tenuis]|uniref:Uncharacterized protein n=1 Tax=Nesidiocoris tenuis TaxID=355587 RepID=A0A6H5G8P6_9HEMI|nr:unnamed protein product [Nesidiocoris tenuis]